MSRSAIGIDVGGTKIAAGLLSVPDGRVYGRRQIATASERGGEAVLGDVIELARSLQAEAIGGALEAVGVGVAELVDPHGNVLSAATIRWQGLPVTDRVHAATSLRTRIDADVRAAARAEAALGAGRGCASFVYVTVGTGISASLVLRGVPYTGARGLTGTFASAGGMMPDVFGNLITGMPLEQFAGGPALARQFAAAHAGFAGSGKDVARMADEGTADAIAIVENAGRALGSGIAQLVNMLDPEAIVLGGGLGLAGGRYGGALAEALREHVWSDLHRDIPLLPAQLGVDAGWIGAALGATAV